MDRRGSSQKVSTDDTRDLYPQAFARELTGGTGIPKRNSTCFGWYLDPWKMVRRAYVPHVFLRYDINKDR